MTGVASAGMTVLASAGTTVLASAEVVGRGLVLVAARYPRQARV